MKIQYNGSSNIIKRLCQLVGITYHLEQEENDKRTLHLKSSDGSIDDTVTIPGDDITVDDALSDRSENPVQNKVISAAMGTLDRTIAGVFDRVIDLSNSMEKELEKKQDTLIAGSNITITGNIISATGGSGGNKVYREVTYVQETSDDARTSASVNISVDKPALLVFVIMHRGNITVDSSWKLEATASCRDYIDTTLIQNLTVYTKSVDVGTYTCQATQDDSKKISVKAIAIYDDASISLFDVNTDIDTATYTPPAAPYDFPHLFLATEIYAAGTSISCKVDNLTPDWHIQQMEETRLSAFYDWQPYMQKTPTITFDSTYAKTSICMSFIVKCNPM